jgi:tetratricopeptide (TPR) repeat protein
MSTRIFLPALLLLFAQCLLAQTLADAKRLSETGRHAEAEKAYNAILESEPDNIAALNGAGYNYSWWKQHDKAQQKFEAVLALDPANAEALVGKGYNLAWNGQYAAAKYPFMALLRQQPTSVEARKGLAYVYLWQGNGPVAIDYFEKLLLEFPRDIEYYIALAQAYLIENRIKKARIALQSGLQIDSTHPVANELLKNTAGIAAPVELDVWTGYSKAGDMGTFNLRTVQLTAQVAKKLRMFLKYDNSLTLDLASLVRSNQEAQAFSIGAVVPWHSRMTSRFEYGTRLLPDNVTQQVFSTEQVYFLSEKLSLKGGGFFALSNAADNEWLAYGSVRVPVTKFYALEPYYFYSRVENAPRPENRFMLNNQLRAANGYELNIGALYGKAGVGPDIAEDNIYGGYATAILPFSQVVWGQLSLRWEKSPFDELIAAAFGIKVRLER